MANTNKKMTVQHKYYLLNSIRFIHIFGLINMYVSIASLEYVFLE